MHTHILIATDGSALAEKAIRAGVDLAKASGAKLTIVTISEAFPAYDLGTKLGLFRDQAKGEPLPRRVTRWREDPTARGVS